LVGAEPDKFLRERNRESRWMDVLVSDVPAFKGESPHAKLGLEPFLCWQAIDMGWATITGFGVADMELCLILRRAFLDYQGRGIFLIIGRRPLTSGCCVQ